MLNSHDYDDIIDRALDRMELKHKYNHWHSLKSDEAKAESKADRRKHKTRYQRLLRAKKRDSNNG